MKRFGTNLIGVDQGSLILFSDFEDGGQMWTGHGPREARRQVHFSEAFRTVPAVMVGISMWDLDQKSNQRSDISADKHRLGFRDRIQDLGRYEGCAHPGRLDGNRPVEGRG